MLLINYLISVVSELIYLQNCFLIKSLKLLSDISVILITILYITVNQFPIIEIICILKTWSFSVVANALENLTNTFLQCLAYAMGLHWLGR